MSSILVSNKVNKIQTITYHFVQGNRFQNVFLSELQYVLFSVLNVSNEKSSINLVFTKFMEPKICRRWGSNPYSLAGTGF
jgi:hypothetical protein